MNLFKRNAWLARAVLLLLPLSIALAQDSDREIYKLNPTPDAQSPTNIYIPMDLDDAFRELKKICHPRFLEKFQNGDIRPIEMHFGLGIWMRNNWGLWGGSRLAKYFNGLGIHHPDDMSSIILDNFQRHLQGKPLEVEKQIKHYQEYWRVVKEPKGDELRFPECPGGVVLEGYLSDETSDGLPQAIHFGRCKANKTLWVFERDKGWYVPTEEMVKRIGGDEGTVRVVGNLNVKPKKQQPKNKRKRFPKR